MTYLLDTNVCIRFLNNSIPMLTARMLACLPGSIVLCDIVKAELHYGAERSSAPEKNLRNLDEFLAGFLSLPFDGHAARNAGAQWAVDGGEWHNSGNTVSHLSVGTHTVSFKEIDEDTGGCFGPHQSWQTPADQTVSISQDQVATFTGTYERIAKAPTVHEASMGSRGDFVIFGAVATMLFATRLLTSKSRRLLGSRGRR